MQTPCRNGNMKQSTATMISTYQNDFQSMTDIERQIPLFLPCIARLHQHMWNKRGMSWPIRISDGHLLFWLWLPLCWWCIRVRAKTTTEIISVTNSFVEVQSLTTAMFSVMFTTQPQLELEPLPFTCSWLLIWALWQNVWDWYLARRDLNCLICLTLVNTSWKNTVTTSLVLPIVGDVTMLSNMVSSPAYTIPLSSISRNHHRTKG